MKIVRIDRSTGQVQHLDSRYHTSILKLAASHVGLSLSQFKEIIGDGGELGTTGFVYRMEPEDCEQKRGAI